MIKIGMGMMDNLTIRKKFISFLLTALALVSGVIGLGQNTAEAQEEERTEGASATSFVHYEKEKTEAKKGPAAATASAEVSTPKPKETSPDPYTLTDDEAIEKTDVI